MAGWIQIKVRLPILNQKYEKIGQFDSSKTGKLLVQNWWKMQNYQ